MVLTRVSQRQPRTAAYMQRRRQGLTKREIFRCLKRYVAREIFTACRGDLIVMTGLARECPDACKGVP